METVQTALEFLQSKALPLAEFYGRVRGLVDMRDENYLSDFDVLLRLRELIAIHEAEKQ